MSNATSEVTWVIRLLQELGVHDLSRVTLFCDNQSAIHIAKNLVFHDPTNHIEIDCHYTRDKVLEGLLELSHLPTSQQLDDILTKILPSYQFNKLLSKLSVVRQPTPSFRGILNIMMLNMYNVLILSMINI